MAYNIIIVQYHVCTDLENQNEIFIQETPHVFVGGIYSSMSACFARGIVARGSGHPPWKNLTFGLSASGGIQAKLYCVNVSFIVILNMNMRELSSTALHYLTNSTVIILLNCH